jgi:hypothetical protein
MYVGITSRKVTIRWNNGKGYIRNQHFTNAINKYSWNNFEHEIIAENLTEQEAKNFEILLIKNLSLTDENIGYNITLGGDGITGMRNINSHKKVYQYTLDGFFIKEWDCGLDIERELGFDAGNINTCCNGRNHTSNGFIWSFKKSSKIAGYINNRFIMIDIYQYDYNGTFLKLYHTTDDILVDYPKYKIQNIYICCTGITKSAYGFIWSLDDNQDKINNISLSINCRVAVNQLDAFGSFINKYMSYKDAENKTNVKTEKIRYHMKSKKFDKINKCYWLRNEDYISYYK